ncbi:MAG: hypothetical protein H6Q05_2989 [Acidobacteria bacterium]|jgi:hypothetical protein|nr:hypothetical protein [Acidobacteriota bacterium]
MGQTRSPLPVKLFVGTLTSLPDIMPRVEQLLVARFGPVDLRSDNYPFDLTHYYDDAMGSPITRSFLAFRNLIPADQLADVKEETNALEAELALEYRQVRRPINLDPGYLEESKIVLASTKNFYHRILLAGGIYGEVTLHFSGGAWQSFPWSFPDFRSGRYDEIFTRLRQVYRKQLKERSEGR